MNRLFIVAALLLASPAFAQDYPGDDEYSWQQQPADQPPPPQQGPTLDDFRNDGELSSTGQWVDTQDYGQVWQPTAVGQDWQPYMYGHWAWTEAGWAWVSDEAFGWAVYHYGRWGYSDDFGWFWVPGRVWSPAWVAWRSNGDYSGWSPLGPRGAVVEPRRWVWVDHAHFLEPVQQHHVRPVAQGMAMPPPQSGPRAGPPVAVVERASGHPVRPLTVRETPSPHAGQPGGGSVYFYRPHTAPVVQQPPRPQSRPYFGGVPGPAYGGTPRPRVEQAAPPQNAPHAAPPAPHATQPAPKAKPAAEPPHTKEK